jgi:tetratricopeptide (TPR) repeat protein
LDETILVFTSDHGESLGEHDESTHAIFIYESTVRVPLIFRYPRKLPAGRVYSESVRSVDLMPTILALAGETPNHTQGTDLSKALVSATPPPALPQYSESLYPEVAFGMAPIFGLRLDEWTYIRAPRPELYNRANDPGEVHNLLEPSHDSRRADAKNQAAKLDGMLSKRLDESKSFGFVAQAKPLDEATVEMLQALGYMGSSAPSDALRGMDPKDGVHIFAKMQEAFGLIGNGDCRSALAALEPLLVELPNLAVVRNAVAKCEVRMGNSKAAEKHYLKSLAHDPNQDDVLLQLGRLRLAAGDRGGARQRFLQALALIPESADAMILLGYVEQSEGRLEEAKRWYAKAIDADPARPDAYIFHGELSFNQGNIEEAKRWYDKALEVAPRSFAASLQAGICALSLGAGEEAERYLSKANEIEPGSWPPLYALACVRAARGDSDAALAYLESAVGAGFSDGARLQADPCFRSVSGTPRFEQLVQKLGRAAPQ